MFRQLQPTMTGSETKTQTFKSPRIFFIYSNNFSHSGIRFTCVRIKASTHIIVIIIIMYVVKHERHLKIVWQCLLHYQFQVIVILQTLTA